MRKPTRLIGSDRFLLDCLRFISAHPLMEKECLASSEVLLVSCLGRLCEVSLASLILSVREVFVTGHNTIDQKIWGESQVLVRQRVHEKQPGIHMELRSCCHLSESCRISCRGYVACC